jgi:hypothetical protein
MSDGPDWFAPRRFGYGSGLPIAWQGWAVYLGYFVLLGTATLLLRRALAGYISVVVMLTVILMVICARTTKGGWRWRWGDSGDA